MNAKGQVSVEFIIVLILLFGVLLFSLAVFGERNQLLVLSQERYEAQLAANQIAEKANSVLIAGPGTETTFYLGQLQGFTPSVAGNAVRVSWKDNFVDSALLSDKVTVNGLGFGREIRIENLGGAILIDFA